MPTHKDLPDAYFDDEPEWRGPREVSHERRHRPRRRRRKSLLRARAPLVLVLILGLSGLGLLLTRTNDLSPASVHARAGARARGATRHGKSRRRGAGARTSPPAGSRTAPPVTGLRSPLQPRKLLAIGTSLPGAGRPPQLLAFGQRGSVIVHSRSSMPMTVSVIDGYGSPIRYWQTLGPGQGHSTTLITGKAYGYCFSQKRGNGYAATRGCGTLVMHQYLNGVRLPDGAALPEDITFALR
jgi:hypothetical protein